jgi:hypothetical protein
MIKVSNLSPLAMNVGGGGNPKLLLTLTTVPDIKERPSFLSPEMKLCGTKSGVLNWRISSTESEIV